MAMHQRTIAWVSLALGLLLPCVTGRADEDSAIATVRRIGATVSRANRGDPRSPVFEVNFTLIGTRRKIGSAELRALKEFKQLRWLVLDGTDLNDAGLYEIRELRSLQKLVLIDTRITDAGLVYLKELPELRELYLGSTRITDAGLQTLKDFNGLRELYLNRTRVTDAGMKALKALPNLRGLTLDETLVTDTGVYELIEAPSLESLLLSKTRVTDHGLKLVPYFKHIKQVQVWYNRGVTPAGVSALRQARPELTVGTEHRR